MGGSGDWARRLQTWLEPFLVRLGHPARRRMCPLYVAGLIGPGERTSLQPIAARLAPADYDQLHHFITVGPWDDGTLEAETLAHPDRDRKSTRLNSSHANISYAVFCLKKKT